MLRDKELYGDETPPEIPAYVIMRRLEILNDRLADVLKEGYETRNLGTVRRIEKAIHFWSNIDKQGEDN